MTQDSSSPNAPDGQPNAWESVDGSTSGDDHDPARFQELVESVKPAMTRAAWAILRDWQRADDAVQEAFCLFVRRRAEIAEAVQKGWLVKTAVLKARELRRSDGRQRSLAEKYTAKYTANFTAVQPAEGLASGDASPESLGTDEKQRLATAIEGLPEAQRQTVLLRLKDEMTFAQIAEHLDTPISTVLSRMRLALKKLRREMNGPGDTDSSQLEN